MKVLHFTIPVPDDKSVIIDMVNKPHHYPYLHRHKEIQLTWIQKGEGTLIAGNSMQDYASGDIFLIGANLPHVFKSSPEYFAPESNLSVKSCTVFFSQDGILSGLFNTPEMKALKCFLQHHELGFKIPNDHVSGISKLMTELKTSNGAQQLINFINLLQGLNDLNGELEILTTGSPLPVITENDGIRICNIYNYIIQKFSEPITLEDVAREAFMTPESFCRYFKKHTGRTFISFLNEIRVNEACKRLTVHKSESISVIAYQCGFNSITNFNRVFKSVMGASPREYLENYFNNLKIATKIAS